MNAYSALSIQTFCTIYSLLLKHLVYHTLSKFVNQENWSRLVASPRISTSIQHPSQRNNIWSLKGFSSLYRPTTRIKFELTLGVRIDPAHHFGILGLIDISCRSLRWRSHELLC